MLLTNLKIIDLPLLVMTIIVNGVIRVRQETDWQEKFPL